VGKPIIIKSAGGAFDPDPPPPPAAPFARLATPSMADFNPIVPCIVVAGAWTISNNNSR
jgi:hypothetical protein